MRLNNSGLKIISAAVLWLSLSPGPALAAQTAQRSSNAASSPQILSRRVGTKVTLRAEGKTLLGAILQLGVQQRIPMGIECVDHNLLTMRVNRATGPATVGGVLDAILSSASGFYWKEDAGVVNISCRDLASQKKNMLNLVLRRFSMPECTMGDASHLLRMAIFWQLHPGVAVAGNYNPGRSKNLIGPLELRDVTVRAALNQIISLGPRGAWIVQVPPRFTETMPPSGLWQITAYDDPTIKYEAEGTRQSILSYPSK